ncbi:trp operon leader peptide [Salmonella bongori]|nr:trp operon leader peptide [Salmonella bongori]EIZ4347661.1 trp operon leader peptide [Salmonella bongori serovar 48:z81:-]QVP39180.1 trp operon leader peptide [Salmonella bongori serovar 40:z35:-]EIL5512172.1 trp operon leader peptide [Salmonella bongori]EJX9719764.1 trp operon leader peptide [Salmonella bongori]
MSLKAAPIEIKVCRIHHNGSGKYTEIGIDITPSNQLTSTKVHLQRVSKMTTTFVLHGWWRTS